MKKQRWVWPVVALLMVVPNWGRTEEAVGLASGHLATAEPCGFGVGNIGAIVGLGDNSNNFLGSISYGFSQYTEGRLKLGLSDADRVDASLMFGADFKYQFLSRKDSNHPPLDMALGGFFEWVDYDILSVLDLGGQIIGSYNATLSNGQHLIPYGRFGIRIENVSIGDESESDLRFGLNLGTKYEPSRDLGFFAEFQLDGNTGLWLGVEFRAF